MLILYATYTREQWFLFDEEPRKAFKESQPTGIEIELEPAENDPNGWRRVAAGSWDFQVKSLVQWDGVQCTCGPKYLQLKGLDPLIKG